MNQNVLDKLDSHNWESSLLTLSAYVVMLCRFKRWKLPSHLEPEDLVLDAIGKVYSGSRVWNPEADPDLADFMRSVLKSMISNEITKSAINTVGASDSILEKVPAENVISEQLEYESLDHAITGCIRGDPELAILYKALKDGLKPAEIAEEYHINIRTIRNAQKRLRRLVTDEVLDKS